MNSTTKTLLILALVLLGIYALTHGGWMLPIAGVGLILGAIGSFVSATVSAVLTVVATIFGLLVGGVAMFFCMPVIIPGLFASTPLILLALIIAIVVSSTSKSAPAKPRALPPAGPSGT